MNNADNIPIDKLFSKDIFEYLKPTADTLDKYGIDFMEILKAIVTPSKRYFFRRNLTKTLSLDDTAPSDIDRMLIENKIYPRNLPEDALQAVLWAPIDGPNRLEILPKKVYTDKFGGEAVRIGADLFRPGVLRINGPVAKGDKASIFVDISRIPGELVFFLKSAEHGYFHVANGIVMMSNSEFNSKTTGVFLKNIEPRYRVPDFRNSLLYRSGMISDQNIPAIIAMDIFSEKIIEVITNSAVYLNAIRGSEYDRILIPEKAGDTRVDGGFPENVPVIFDTCAAPGHKTCALSEFLHYKLYNRGIVKIDPNYNENDYKSKKWVPIYAIDRSPRRLQHLSADRKRLGLGNIRIIPYHLEKILKKYPFARNAADFVLFDPPCSALGQRPKLFLYRDLPSLEDYAKNQRRLLKIVDKMVKPGGYLMYNTCTMAVQEDEGIVSYALEKLNYEIVGLPSKYRNIPREGILMKVSGIDNPIRIPAIRGSPYGVLEHRKDLDNLIKFVPSIEEGAGYFIALLRKRNS